MVNLSAVSNLTQVTEIFNVASLFSDGILGIIILFVIFFGLLMFLSSFSRVDSFLASSFVTLVLSIFLRYIGLIDDTVVLIILAIFFVSLGASFFAKSATTAV